MLGSSMDWKAALYTPPPPAAAATAVGGSNSISLQQQLGCHGAVATCSLPPPPPPPSTRDARTEAIRQSPAALDDLALQQGGLPTLPLPPPQTHTPTPRPPGVAHFRKSTRLFRDVCIYPALRYSTHLQPWMILLCQKGVPIPALI
jgi:hypothetical protein